MTARPNNPAKFAAWFVILFVVFYYGNYAYIGITSPGKIYSPFLDQYLNYIRGLRHLLLAASRFILKCLGFDAITNDYDLLVPGHAIIRLAYDCLGLGVMSFFTAFVLAYPRSRKQKIIFLLFGLLAIQLLNVLRFVWLALYWTRKSNELADHHTIFNILIYILIAIALYFWVKADNTVNKQHAANPA